MPAETPAAPAAEAAPSPGSVTTEAAAPLEDSRERPRSYLVLFNVGKKQNFGTLLRSAGAFGVHEVCVVGARKLATFGSQGTATATQQRYFDTLEDAKADLSSKGVKLCGVEIDDSAVPIHKHPFTGPTAFMLGNEGAGMSPQQRAACDFFVYIPQHTGVTASLNVAIAGSIVLHHFAIWAQLPEQPRFGEKYVLDPRRHGLDKYQNPTELERAEIDRKRAERAAKRKKPSDADGAGYEAEEEDVCLDDLDDAEETVEGG